MNLCVFLLLFWCALPCVSCGRREGVMRRTILNRTSDGADDQVDGMVSSLTVIRDNLSNPENVSADTDMKDGEREREGEKWTLA